MATPVTTLNDLTTGVLEGTGVFDKLMATAKAHLDAEFKKGSIRGPEYSQVYLGQVQAVLQTSVQFLANRQKISLEADLLAAQIALAGAQLLQVQAQTELVHAQTELAVQQKLNAVIEGTVLVAQECKLRAEYDLTVNTTLKTTSEIALLSQKVATERAQTQDIGVDDNSVIGKQKALYQAQTSGFTRDAEQKAAKLLIDTWNARRMTDEGTVADGVNMLNDATVGAFVTKLKAGIGA